MDGDEGLRTHLANIVAQTMTSSVRDGSWITHMQGTQSILACRDSINHNDNDQYLYVLCKHLVGIKDQLVLKGRF